MQDIRPYTLEQFIEEWNLKREARKRLRQRGDIDRVMRAIAKANIQLECSHERTETVETVDVEVNGVHIDGEKIQRCANPNCHKTLEFIA